MLDKEQRLVLALDPNSRPISNIPFGYAVAPRPLTPDWGGYLNYGVFSSPTVEGGRIGGRQYAGRQRRSVGVRAYGIGSTRR